MRANENLERLPRSQWAWRRAERAWRPPFMNAWRVWPSSPSRTTLGHSVRRATAFHPLPKIRLFLVGLEKEPCLPNKKTKFYQYLFLKPKQRGMRGWPGSAVAGPALQGAGVRRGLTGRSRRFRLC